jgi:plasmid segregation protein ParM
MGQQALREAGFGGKDVTLATGIPVQMYFSGEDGNKNDILLNRKKKAFVEADIKNKLDDKGNPTLIDTDTLVKVRSNTVIPEAVGAYMDLTINADGSEGATYEGDVLIIDMGSYTTDIAVIGPGGLIRKEYVNTLEDCGFLNLYDKFRRVAQEHGIKYGKIPSGRIETALKTGKLKVLNGEIDVSEVVEKVVEASITPIVERIKVLLADDIQFLEAIIGVGGGAELVKEYFGELGDAIIIPDEPQFANSRGYLKTLTYCNNLEVVDDLQEALAEA